jgi:hypothetical protein
MMCHSAASSPIKPSLVHGDDEEGLKHNVRKLEGCDDNGVQI